MKAFFLAIMASSLIACGQSKVKNHRTQGETAAVSNTSQMEAKTSSPTPAPGSSFPFKITSVPSEVIPVVKSFYGKFEPNEIFVAMPAKRKIAVFSQSDDSLRFLREFTHPAFGADGGDYTKGPTALLFNKRGNLIVAVHGAFVELEYDDVEYKTYAKKSARMDNSIAEDKSGNLYSASSTSGKDTILQYKADHYEFAKEISLPEKAGTISAVALDRSGRLFAASKADDLIYVMQADDGFPGFTLDKTIAGVPGIADKLNALQINSDAYLMSAQERINAINPKTGGYLNLFVETAALPQAIALDAKRQMFVLEHGGCWQACDCQGTLQRMDLDGAKAMSLSDAHLSGAMGIAVSPTRPVVDTVTYTYEIKTDAAAGSKLKVSLIRGPPGMTVNEAGIVTWAVPSLESVFDVTVEVKDDAGQVARQDFSLTVAFKSD